MPISYSALWIAHTLVKHADKCLDEAISPSMEPRLLASGSHAMDCVAGPRRTGGLNY